MRLILAAAWLACGAGPARGESTATLGGTDLYRSERLTLAAIEERVGPMIRSYLTLRGDRRASSQRSAERIRGDIEREIAEIVPVAFVRLHYAEYFTSAKHTAYLTFDVVDPADAQTRMPFKAAPAGQAPDPGGLCQAWKEFEELGSTLRKKGLLSFARPSCPAFYCLWGSQTPQLAAYEEMFSKGAATHRQALEEVLGTDADPRKRSAALYVLSYMRDGAQLARIATEALFDPDETVRGAALLILSDLVVYHKKLRIDITTVITAMDYPTASDRAKALAVLVGAAEDPEYRKAILMLGRYHLPRLLRLEQPSNHDLAYTLLGFISGESFGRRDYEAWEHWLYKRKSPPKSGSRR